MRLTDSLSLQPPTNQMRISNSIFFITQLFHTTSQSEEMKQSITNECLKGALHGIFIIKLRLKVAKDY